MTTVTHSFNLTSGPLCEVTALGAKHQKILTSTSDKQGTSQSRLTDVLKSLIVRIGNVYLAELSDKERDAFMDSLLVSDRKQILCEARNFTVKDDPDFIFEFKYVDRSGKDASERKILSIEEGEWPYRPVMRYDRALVDKTFKKAAWYRLWDNNPEGEEEGSLSTPLQPLNADNYDEVVANARMEFILPDSGKLVVINMRDGLSDKIGEKVKAADRNSHAVLLTSRPAWKDEGTGTPILFRQYDLDQLSQRDIDRMRFVLGAFEAKVDTEVRFEHPEADSKLLESDKWVTTDLLAQMSFFFQSGGM